MDKFLIPDTCFLPSNKPALRRIMEKCRAAAFIEKTQASTALSEHFQKAVVLPPDAIVSGYVAHGSEINPAPVIEMLRAMGHRIALPVMTARGTPLLFRLHESDAPLIANAVGIPEPAEKQPLMEPDVLLVPLLAFDRRGARLGSGGGYYDRTIPALRRIKPVLAIGVAFSCQELHEIAVESHDVPLDMVVTELQVFNFLSP